MQENNVVRNNKGKFYLIALAIGSLLYIAMTLVYSFSASLATQIKYPNIESIPAEIQNNFLSVVQMLYCVPLVALAIYFFKDDLKNDFINLKENFVKHRTTVLLGIFGCLALTGVVSQIYMWLGIEGDSANQEIINEVLLGPGWWPMVISVVLIAPFIEEMLFRKIFCGVCEHTCRFKPIVTILASTILFALIHVADLENLKFIFQYIPLAFVITFSYHYSKNIYVPIAIHLLNNLLSVVMLYLAVFLGV